MHITSRARAGDRGFTLIEMLISIVILGIIAVPLSMAMFSYFKNSDTTTSRINESAQIQIASSYFARDVSLTGIRDTGVAPAAPPLPPFGYKQSVWTTSVSTGCGTLAGALVLGGDDYSSDVTTPTRFYVAYQLSGSDLHRVRCTGSTKADTVIARNVTAATASCSSTCTGTPPPTTVTLVLTVDVTDGNPGSYSVTLTGSRVQTYPSS
jgi:prepilin-type N-terminal cleavage/methylation domain-containing protein